MRWLFIVSLFFLFSCNNKEIQSDTETDTEASAKVEDKLKDAPEFNADSAYAYIVKQLSFGPRKPGTKGHSQCYDYLRDYFKPLADTIYLQKTRRLTWDNANIPVYNLIAEFNKDAKRRILLCAHWDTRPIADRDTSRRNEPIPGANDGASGVAVLMEIASKVKELNRDDIGIDFILFDAEDWGDPEGRVQNSYCLGSQYWAKNLHRPDYRAEFGILLDMVGAPNALFGYEQFSAETANRYMKFIWSTADKAGYGHYFRNFTGGNITDDHYYIFDGTTIPVVDIIHYDPDTYTKFGKYWHTHQDDIDAIDKNTLKAVGQTVLHVLVEYN